MPIDPRIAMGIQPVQVDSPLNTLGRMYAFREQQAQAQAREMAMRKAQQAEVDQQTLNQAYSAPKMTRKTAIESVQRAGQGHLVPVINKQFDDWDEAAAKRNDLLDKAAQAEQGYMGRLFQGVEQQNYDPVAARAAIDHAEATFGPSFADKAASYRTQLAAAGDDPAKVKQFIKNVQAQDPGYAARQTSAASAARAATAQETADLEKPKKQAEVRQVQRADAAARIGAARNQQEYDKLLDDTEMPGWLRKMFLPKYDAERIQAVGLTPEQAAVNTDRDLTRAQTIANETAMRNIQARAAATGEGNLAQRKIEATERANRLSGPDALSAEAHATASRWKATQLDKLRDSWDFDQNKGLPADEAAANVARYDAERLRIENEYRDQVQLPKLTALPRSYDPPKGATATSSAAVAPPGTLGGLMPPPPTKAAAPKVTPAASVPDQIRDYLKDRPAGTLRAPDGTLWRKERNGTIVRVGS